MKSPFSRRVRTIAPRPQINPISGRPYSSPEAPQYAEVFDAERDPNGPTQTPMIARVEAPGDTLTRLLIEGGMSEKDAAAATHTRAWR